MPWVAARTLSSNHGQVNFAAAGITRALCTSGGERCRLRNRTYLGVAQPAWLVVDSLDTPPGMAAHDHRAVALRGIADCGDLQQAAGVVVDWFAACSGAVLPPLHGGARQWGLSAVQDPSFSTAKEVVSTESGDDLVVGIVVDSDAYAFRYAALQHTPVIVATLRERRIALLWSELANRALAFTAARDLRAEDLGDCFLS